MSLDRFIDAQQSIYDQALQELREGRKTSHWMWYIFPQLRGLGHSPTAHHYGIEDLAEARAYLAHETLGPRLLTCAEAILSHEDTSATDILGPVDALKLRSCATLFERAGGGERYTQILDRFYDGARCPLTLACL